VQLVENNRWDRGNPKWGAIHEGRTYLFAGPDEQRRFLEHPERYAPVLSGDDPVVALEENRRVPGSREWGVFYRGRIYLFAGQQSRYQFAQDAERYAQHVLGATRPRRDYRAR
jgi:protein disulfide-isomerase